MREVTSLKKEPDEAKVAVLESKTDHERKDEYIDHLVLLLEPHLAILPTNVVNKICHILEEIRVDIAPSDH